MLYEMADYKSYVLAWLDSRDVSRREFCAYLGIGRPSFGRFLTGEGDPHLSSVQLILEGCAKWDKERGKHDKNVIFTNN